MGRCCNGQILAINQNQALFSILGTTYGGNGVSTFQLPNMQSRIPYNWGQGPGPQQTILWARSGGEENHTLLMSENAASQSSCECGQRGTERSGSCWQHLESERQCIRARLQTVWFQGPTSDLRAATNRILIAHHTWSSHFCIALVGTFPSRN